jgi:hypothetical protein
MRTRQRERLPQLLYDPLARWVRRGVEVENAPAAVFDYKEAKVPPVAGYDGKAIAQVADSRRDHSEAS